MTRVLNQPRNMKIIGCPAAGRVGGWLGGWAGGKSRNSPSNRCVAIGMFLRAASSRTAKGNVVRTVA